MSVTISAEKLCSGRLYLQLFVGGHMSYLRYLCLFATHIVLCFCFCFVFLRLVYPMLPVSLDCSFWIARRYSLTFKLLEISADPGTKLNQIGTSREHMINENSNIWRYDLVSPPLSATPLKGTPTYRAGRI